MASVSTRSSSSRDLPTTGCATGTETLNSSAPSRFKIADGSGLDVADERFEELAGLSVSKSRNDLEAVGFCTAGAREIGCFPFAVDSLEEEGSEPDALGLSGKKYDISGRDVIEGELMLEWDLSGVEADGPESLSGPRVL
jgi:hypothetical protein